MASSRQLVVNTSQYFRPKPPSLKIREEICRGAYGSVHFGELDGRPVAVKRIHRLLLEAARGQGDFEQVMSDFKRECQLLEKIDHPHVVDFRGAFYDEKTDEPLLVMERMRENLREFLERKRNDLSQQKQLEVCLAIARGLRFLHTQTPPIVHRDLTDKNVMLGRDGLVKIGDLGQSRLKANNAEYFSTAQPGAIPFMPPEAMQEQSRYNEKLDIFSLGVLMLEVATQQPPRVRLVGIGTVKEIVRRREDLSKLEEDHPLKPLILSCLEDDPKQRPDIVTVHTQLQAIVEGVEATATDLRSQITTLQAALEGEIAARKEHEVKLSSQFQSEVASRDANIRQLEEKCKLLEVQAMACKLDFQHERSDRENVIGRFDEEREALQADISKLNVQLAAVKLEHDDTSAQLQQTKELSLLTKNEEVLPQSPLPPSLHGKEVHNVKLPDMPMGAAFYAATIHNSKVYISAFGRDGNGKLVCPVLVYSTNEHKWSTLREQQRAAAIAVLNSHITLIGGQDVSTGKVTNTLSSWYEEDGQWKQVLPPMPTGRYCPAVICHANLLLVTGGLAGDVSTLCNTTDVLDLTTMKWSAPEGLNLPIPLWRHHLALCDEYLYLVGGTTVYPWQSPEEYNSQAWRAKWSDVKQTAAPQHFQPQRGVWTRIADPPTLLPTLVSCGGTLYTVGGVTRGGKPISTVYTYITARNQWVSAGDMSVGRAGHCAVPLSCNTIFVAGGKVVNEGKWAFSSLTELLLL